MAELTIREFEGYDAQTMGKPWAAVVLPNGKLNFDKTITKFTGDLEQGSAGALILRNAADGLIYATGQKNRMTKEGNIEYHHCTGNAFETVTKEAVQKMVEFNIAAVSQENYEQSKLGVEQQIKNYRTCNNIVTLMTIDPYDQSKKARPWITEYTKDGLSFDQRDSLDAKPIGRVVGNPGSHMVAIAINPTPEQVFVVAQQDLETKNTKMKFFEIDENNNVKALSRQAVNEKLDIKNKAFIVTDEGKIVKHMPDGYDTDRYSMWIAKEMKQSDGKSAFVSKTADGISIGNYSGGKNGEQGQFYVRKPEQDAVYALFQRDYDTGKTSVVVKVRHMEGQMHDLSMGNDNHEATKKIIQSFPAFNEETFENPYVGKVTGEGKMRCSLGRADSGRNLFVGGYTGRKGLGEAGDVFVWNPQEGDAYAVCQTNNQTLRPNVQFFVYAKENFIEVDRETAIEQAKQKEHEQAAQAAPAVDDTKSVKEMKLQVQSGEALSSDQVKSLETYRQIYAKKMTELPMVAEGRDVVLAEIGAYDSAEHRNPYITKRGGNGKFSFINDVAQAEFVGGPEKGGKIIIRNAQDGDVFTYGQARQDGETQAATYVAIAAGQAVLLGDKEEYKEWKNETKGKGKAPEKSISLAEATQGLAAKGISGDKALQALLKQGNIKEFAGKSAAQRNQLVGSVMKDMEKGKEQSRSRD